MKFSISVCIVAISYIFIHPSHSCSSKLNVKLKSIVSPLIKELLRRRRAIWISNMWPDRFVCVHFSLEELRGLSVVPVIDWLIDCSGHNPIYNIKNNNGNVYITFWKQFWSSARLVKISNFKAQRFSSHPREMIKGVPINMGIHWRIRFRLLK